MTSSQTKCAHPDPKTLPWCVCRICGHWAEGVRVGDFSPLAVIEHWHLEETAVVVLKTTGEIERIK